MLLFFLCLYGHLTVIDAGSCVGRGEVSGGGWRMVAALAVSVVIIFILNCTLVTARDLAGIGGTTVTLLVLMNY